MGWVLSGAGLPDVDAVVVSVGQRSGHGCRLEKRGGRGGRRVRREWGARGSEWRWADCSLFEKKTVRTHNLAPRSTTPIEPAHAARRRIHSVILQAVLDILTRSSTSLIAHSSRTAVIVGATHRWLFCLSPSAHKTTPSYPASKTDPSRHGGRPRPRSWCKCSPYPDRQQSSRRPCGRDGPGARIRDHLF